ncbi:AfsR/SARP family transcriptional regulator [Salinactinospora qingdaonensis]|uniref:BTAD domain-containing putative transcriptional regulator n=1 Tax=Salinactinospora qingdaonensis TaxID=702744 RepID=A0ABP7F1Y3_9ACTN
MEHKVNLLGPLEIFVGNDMVPLRSERERTVMALLALNLGRPVAADSLIDAVWSGNPPQTARNQLAICVSSLRKELYAPKNSLIATTPAGYTLQAASVTTDLRLAEQRINKARAARSASCDEDAVRHLRSAIALWRGTTLGDLSSLMLRSEAARIERWRASVQEECLELEIEQGWYQDAVNELTLLVDHEPYQEHLRALLMRAFYGMGQRSEALAVFSETRKLLAEELGIDPGAELQETHGMILRGAAVPPPRALPAYSVESAPLSWESTGTGTVSQGTGSGTIPQQLPPPPVGFRGRDDELSRLHQEFELRTKLNITPRIVITGMGGVGKTALALNWTHQVAKRFPDGQLYIDMCSFTEGATPLSASDVLHTFLRALGISGELIPTELKEQESLFHAELSRRRILMLLDNVHSSEQIRPLLSSEPGSAVLITSRNALEGLAVTHGVSHLHLSTLNRGEAIDLLKSVLELRTTACGMDDAALGELAALCDGLPLALRIAAARITVRPGQSVANLTRRLANEQRRLAELSCGEVNLAANFALSYGALRPESARLFRLLGLVDMPDLPEWTVCALLDTDSLSGNDLLQELLDAHLVEIACEDDLGQMRYRMNDLVRLYARERALAEETESDRRTVLQRCLGGWLFLAREARRRSTGREADMVRSEFPLWSPDPADVAALLNSPVNWYLTERRPLISAVRQAADYGLSELAWNLATSCAQFFLYNSQIKDWRETHEKALEVVRRAGDQRGEAALLCGLGQLHNHTGRPASELFHRAIEIFAQIGDDHGRGLALAAYAVEKRMWGELWQALDLDSQALKALRDARDNESQVQVLFHLARIRIELGDLNGAESDLDCAQQTARDPSHWDLSAHLWRRRAELCGARGDFRGAVDAYTRAFEFVCDGSDLNGQAHLLRDLAAALLRAGDVETAHEKGIAALDLGEHLNDPRCYALICHTMAEIYGARGDIASQTRYIREANARFREMGIPKPG